MTKFTAEEEQDCKQSKRGLNVSGKEYFSRRRTTAPALAAVEQEALEQQKNGIIFLCKTKSNKLDEFMSRLQFFV